MTSRGSSRPVPFGTERPARRGAAARHGVAEPRPTPYWPVDALRDAVDEVDEVEDATGNVRLEQWTRRTVIVSAIAIVLLYLFLLRN